MLIVQVNVTLKVCIEQHIARLTFIEITMEKINYKLQITNYTSNISIFHHTCISVAGL